MFQTSSHCYYTSYDHCVEGKGIKITQFDDGMKQLLPSVCALEKNTGGEASGAVSKDI